MTESSEKNDVLADLGLALAETGHKGHCLYVAQDFNIGSIIFDKNGASVVAKTIHSVTTYLAAEAFSLALAGGVKKWKRQKENSLTPKSNYVKNQVP